MKKTKNKLLGIILILAGILVLSESAMLCLDYQKKYQDVYRELSGVETFVKDNNISAVDQKLSQEKDWRLTITKIGVDAPVITNVDGNNEVTYLSALQNGVAQLEGSALPGRLGNSFIFGHSSYYIFDTGKYKNVFARLDELQKGDEIDITSNYSKYVYIITDKKIVSPDEVEVASNSSQEKKILTLMTCFPVGTSESRLIITAESL